MYDFKFEGYNEKQCHEYLERIGAVYDGQATLENLDMLISKHQKAVPFENLALSDNRGTVDMDPQALFKKVVADRRGGFCFELNGAFLLLLKGLGYDAAGCMARVGLPFIGELLHLDHHGIIVKLDGRYYYCDVGMGGPKADWAVEFDPQIRTGYDDTCTDGKNDQNKNAVRQTRHGQTYWVEDTYEGWKMLKNAGSESDGSVIIFNPVRMLPGDFTANCRYLVERGNTIFHQVRMVNICRENNGYVDIKNNVIKESDGINTTEKEYSEEEFPMILEKYFGIKF